MNLRNRAGSISASALTAFALSCGNTHPQTSQTGASSGAARVTSHDDPIIIENGPVRVKFYGKDAEERGYLVDGRLVSRQPAEPLIRVRMWVNGNEKGCGSGGGEKCMMGKNSARVTLADGKPLTLHWRKESGKKGAVLMTSLDHELEEVDTSGETLSEFKSKDDILVKSVTFWYSGGETTVDLRAPGNTTDVIKVQFCAKDDPTHCPN